MHEEGFWDADHVLFLDQGADSVGVLNSENALNHTLRIHALFCRYINLHLRVYLKMLGISTSV